jgi:hypothetical protein
MCIYNFIYFFFFLLNRGHVYKPGVGRALSGGLAAAFKQIVEALDVAEQSATRRP